MHVTSLAGNSQKLDGGSMFGNAPKALWETWLPPDSEGRVSLQCRCFLVQTESQNILLETGIGNFFPPELKARYGVVEDENVLLSSLAENNLHPDHIHMVILSHLHFDHAGGLLTPEGNLLFPNAQYVTSKVAFERAQNPHPRDRASFIPALVEQLKASDRLILLDEEKASDHSEIPSCFDFFCSHGHTPGQLHTIVQGPKRKFIFCGDLIPGKPWIHAPITMGYDRFPELLIDEKLTLYKTHPEALLGFTHDPDSAACLIAFNRRYHPTECFQSLDHFSL